MNVETQAKQNLNARLAELKMEQGKLTPNPDRVARLKAQIDELRALLHGY